MGGISRRDFIGQSVRAGGAFLAANILGVQGVFAEDKLELNVGFLPITDHLILPVSHSLDNGKYRSLKVKPRLCRSWDEIIGKVDMGVLDAAFLLAPLAMYKFNQGSDLRCVMLGHTNGSVISVGKSITAPEGLAGKSIGIPHARSTHRLLLYKYLKDRGIKKTNTIKLVKVPPPVTVRELKAGKIDAYSVAEPWGIKGVNDGVAHILEYSKNIIPDHVCCLVMVKKWVIDRNLEAVTEWVESLRNAGKFIHENPEKAGIIQENYMRHRPEEIAAIVNDGIISYKDLAPAINKLAVLHGLAMDAGILKNRCNLGEFVDGRFL